MSSHISFADHQIFQPGFQNSTEFMNEMMTALLSGIMGFIVITTINSSLHVQRGYISVVILLITNSELKILSNFFNYIFFFIRPLSLSDLTHLFHLIITDSLRMSKTKNVMSFCIYDLGFLFCIQVY